MAHWFGTDEFGRDVLTRLIYGARIALFIGFASSLLGATAGAILGVVSAYLGGRTDLYLQRLMDIMLAFPLLILALAIVTVLGRSIPNLILAIAIPVIRAPPVLCGLAPSPPRKMSTWKRPVPSAARTYG